jgi:hypothetical protein
MRLTRREMLWTVLASGLAGSRGASAETKPVVTVHRSPT